MEIRKCPKCGLIKKVKEGYKFPILVCGKCGYHLLKISNVDKIDISWIHLADVDLLEKDYGKGHIETKEGVVYWVLDKEGGTTK